MLGRFLLPPIVFWHTIDFELSYIKELRNIFVFVLP